MLKYGTISSIQPSKGTARVLFDDDNIVSQELPVLVKKSFSEKESFPFDINEHVACLMDCNLEDGVILGAIYSQDEKPAIVSADEFGIEYEDGSFMKYNRAQKLYTIKTGDSTLQVKQEGHTVKRGSESLKMILSDLIDAILAETHPTGTGPSGTPINSAQYTAIKTRLDQLFQE